MLLTTVPSHDKMIFVTKLLLNEPSKRKKHGGDPQKQVVESIHPEKTKQNSKCVQAFWNQFAPYQGQGHYLQTKKSSETKEGSKEVQISATEQESAETNGF